MGLKILPRVFMVTDHKCGNTLKKGHTHVTYITECKISCLLLSLLSNGIDINPMFYVKEGIKND